MFNSSFEIYLSNEIYGAGYSYSYDKNLDKIITGGHGGVSEFYRRAITDSKEEGNLYKIKYVEGHFIPSEDGKWEESSIKKEISKNDKKEVEEFIKRNKDKLSNYEIVFEKISTGYKYKSITKIENNIVNNKLNYEIKINGTNKELYVNDKKVNGINADNELGSIEVKEFNDLLIVDERNPGASRRLFTVDKSGNATEIDYKVNTYSSELRNSIDSYRIEENNLYIKVNRFMDGRLDWYCYLDNKNDIVEYEVKYEYINGKLGNRQVINEVTIADKYQNECN